MARNKESTWNCLGRSLGRRSSYIYARSTAAPTNCTCQTVAMQCMRAGTRGVIGDVEEEKRRRARFPAHSPGRRELYSSRSSSSSTESTRRSPTAGCTEGGRALRATHLDLTEVRATLERGAACQCVTRRISGRRCVTGRSAAARTK